MRLFDKKKHKALGEQYDHYVCEICAGIGTKEVIKDLQELYDDYLVYPDGESMLESIRDLIEKWE